MVTLRFGVAMVIAVALAGCTGAEDAPVAGGPDDTEMATDLPESSAVDPHPDNATNGASMPVAFSGNLGTGVLVVSAAAGQEVLLVEPERFFPLGEDGVVTSVTLNLTWSGTAPLNDELRLGLAWGCDDVACDGYDYAQGVSPLHYENVGPIELDPWVFVYTPNRLPQGGAGVYVSVDVAFSIEGTARIVPATA